MVGVHELHATDVARYRWQGFWLSLSGHATARGRMVTEALAGAESGIFMWSRPRDVRAGISILHELIHLQQDVSTGLGAWDHLATRRKLTELVVLAQRFVYRREPPPYRARIDERLAIPDWPTRGRMAEALHEVESRTVAWPQLRGRDWRTPEAAAALSKWAGMSLDALDEEYSLRACLEGEAATLVHGFIRDARATEEAAEELDRYRRLWAPSQMADVYQRALYDVTIAYANGVPSASQFRSLYDQMLLYTPWLLDLIQSYPPPSLLDQYEPDTVMFDPVVRYLVLLRSLNRLSQAEADELTRALLRGEPWQAEKMLLGGCPFPYPTSRRIYAEWLAALAEPATSDEWDSPLFQVRRDAIGHRLRSGRAKGIREFVDARVPVQMLIEGYGPHGILVGQQLLEEVSRPLLSAIVHRNLDLELHDLLLADAAFACPYARIEVCEARTPVCSLGIDRLADLPPEPGCSVRKDLRAVGYSI